MMSRQRLIRNMILTPECILLVHRVLTRRRRTPRRLSLISALSRRELGSVVQEADQIDSAPNELRVFRRPPARPFSRSPVLRLSARCRLQRLFQLPKRRSRARLPLSL